jgi:hypothetical protein
MLVHIAGKKEKQCSFALLIRRLPFERGLLQKLEQCLHLPTTTPSADRCQEWGA